MAAAGSHRRRRGVDVLALTVLAAVVAAAASTSPPAAPPTAEHHQHGRALADLPMEAFMMGHQHHGGSGGLPQQQSSSRQGRGRGGNATVALLQWAAAHRTRVSASSSSTIGSNNNDDAADLEAGVALAAARHATIVDALMRGALAEAWEEVVAGEAGAEALAALPAAVAAQVQDAIVSTAAADIDVNMGMPTAEALAASPRMHAIHIANVRIGGPGASWQPLLTANDGGGHSPIGYLLSRASRAGVPLYGATIPGHGFLPAPSMVVCADEVNGVGCVLRGVERTYATARDANAELVDALARSVAGAAAIGPWTGTTGKDSGSGERSLGMAPAAAGHTDACEAAAVEVMRGSSLVQPARAAAWEACRQDTRRAARALGMDQARAAGAIRVLMVRVLFAGQAESAAITNVSASLVAEQLANATSRSSFGGATYNFTVVPDIVYMPASLATCTSNLNSIVAGVTSWMAYNVTPPVAVSSYARLVMIMSCSFSWSGMGSTPGANTWLATGTSVSYAVNTAFHELGHNFGLNHASAVNPLDGGYTEYGYDGDPMGTGGSPDSVDYQVGYKQDLGWIDPARVLNLGNVAAAGEVAAATFWLGGSDRGDADADGAYLGIRLRSPELSGAPFVGVGQRYVYGTLRSRWTTAPTGIVFNDVPLASGTAGNSLTVELAPYTPTAASGITLLPGYATLLPFSASTSYVVENLGPAPAAAGAAAGTLVVRATAVDAATGAPSGGLGCLDAATCQTPFAPPPLTLPCLTNPTASATVPLNLTALGHPAFVALSLARGAGGVDGVAFVNVTLCTGGSTPVSLAGFTSPPFAEALTQSPLWEGVAPYVGERIWNGTAWQSGCLAMTAVVSASGTVWVGASGGNATTAASLSATFTCVPPTDAATGAAPVYSASRFQLTFSSSTYSCQYFLPYPTTYRNGRVMYDCASRYTIAYATSLGGWYLHPFHSYGTMYKSQVDAASDLLALTSFGGMTMTVTRVCPTNSAFSRDLVACIPLPPGTHSQLSAVLPTGSTNVSSLAYCGPGTYQDINDRGAVTCQPCPAGTAKSASGNDPALCDACSSGSTAPAGSAACVPIVPPAAAYTPCSYLYLSGLHSYFNGIFELQSDAQRGRIVWTKPSAPPTRTIIFSPLTGAYTGTDVGASYYWWNLNTRALPQFWNAGVELASRPAVFAQCVAAPYGAVNAWTACPAGQQPNGATGRCEPCPSGTYRAASYNSTAAAGLCAPCAASKTTSGPGATVCDVTLCGSCTACPAGYNYTGSGQCVDANECAIGNGGCSHGCANTVGGFTCTCPAGWGLGVGGRTCVPCAAGSASVVNATTGVSTCTPCSGANYMQGAAPSGNTCVCPAGWWLAGDGACTPAAALAVDVAVIDGSAAPATDVARRLLRGEYRRCIDVDTGVTGWVRLVDGDGASTVPTYGGNTTANATLLLHNVGAPEGAEWALAPAASGGSGGPRYAWVRDAWLNASAVPAGRRAAGGALPVGSQGWRLWRPYPSLWVAATVSISVVDGAGAAPPSSVYWHSCSSPWRVPPSASPSPSITPSPTASVSTGASASPTSSVSTSATRSSSVSVSGTPLPTTSPSGSASMGASPSASVTRSATSTASVTTSVTSTGSATGTVTPRALVVSFNVSAIPVQALGTNVSVLASALCRAAATSLNAHLPAAVNLTCHSAAATCRCGDILGECPAGGNLTGSSNNASAAVCVVTGVRTTLAVGSAGMASSTVSAVTTAVTTPAFLVNVTAAAAADDRLVAAAGGSVSASLAVSTLLGGASVSAAASSNAAGSAPPSGASSSAGGGSGSASTGAIAGGVVAAVVVVVVIASVWACYRARGGSPLRAVAPATGAGATTGEPPVQHSVNAMAAAAHGRPVSWGKGTAGTGV